ncbi:MAG: mechanosensitive ion channel, partial [Negativicutes bacterium]|nr:mechanosensitive ion channel [Negativicutes bacterium]
MNFIEPWLPSLAIFFGFIVVRIIYRSIIFKFLRLFAKKLPFTTNEDIVGAANHPLQFLILVLALYFALLASPYSFVAYYPVIQHIVRSSILLTVFWTLFNLASTTHNLLVTLLSSLGIQLEESLANIVSAFLRFFLAAVALAMIVSEWGYDISGFIAGLSLGGLAISLAAKDALANVFGSIVIIMDKPFMAGDWISANGVEGTVEKISLRSTSIRTFPQA